MNRDLPPSFAGVYLRFSRRSKGGGEGKGAKYRAVAAGVSHENVVARQEFFSHETQMLSLAGGGGCRAGTKYCFSSGIAREISSASRVRARPEISLSARRYVCSPVRASHGSARERDFDNY